MGWMFENPSERFSAETSGWFSAAAPLTRHRLAVVADFFKKATVPDTNSFEVLNVNQEPEIRIQGVQRTECGWIRANGICLSACQACSPPL
jgi:hypothetical protein